ESPGLPAGVFNWRRCSAAGTLSDMKTRVMPGSRVGDRKARADGERGELIDCVAARAPVRQFLLVELLRHTRLPFARYRPGHRAGVELAAIDVQRKRRPTPNVDSMMVLRARRGGTGSK